ncbi:carbon-nitrogen hydrolase family protein [Octadecabacter sp. 1_MG-2023]|uniref:carbon-nitrogen hydrolase family protein n=1 Tax=unclassified Octadecabacter TaxID=196158 RepID=UPI001C09F3C6|nr:carbon-nitrogen hydrolase family protein [Octadecabacter sp. 1_MG-2023]MBU2992281.1 carbon-nitrogen hydrolase family protein [Octadecabacter sp. B2R22]MDO6734962.1 carbon-nitrogen hydrolase family protein [Octadecabacter sp. 1_MG-2023]
MKVAILQLTSSDDPAENLAMVQGMIADAVSQGAEFICTPEVTNCVSLDRKHQASVLSYQEDDPSLSGLQTSAKEHGIWLSIGSLALKGGDGDRFVNRSFLIAPDGKITATYDKIHMFDVQVNETETYAESSGYAPGNQAVVADIGTAKVGLTICYDLRFPYLHRALAKAGADILLVPAAFSPVTGVAHWEPLLRARAIETGCFVIAAAQTGTHAAQIGKQRTTYGHSLVVSPWGEVLVDAGVAPGVTLVDFTLSDVPRSRERIPALLHDREFSGP